MIEKKYIKPVFYASVSLFGISYLIKLLKKNEGSLDLLDGSSFEYSLTPEQVKIKAKILEESFKNGWSLTDERAVKSVIENITGGDWFNINKAFGKIDYNMFFGAPAYGWLLPFSGKYNLKEILKNELSIINFTLYRSIRQLYEGIGVPF